MAAGDEALKKRIKEGAQIIADGVKRRASWSAHIPASVRVTVAGFTFTISAGGVRAPMAYTFEAPARKGKRAGYPVNHPVWGHGPREDWHWVAQPPRQFMSPAADEDSDKALVAIAQVVDDWAKENGFK